MPSRLVLLLATALALTPGCALTTVVLHANTSFGQQHVFEHTPLDDTRWRQVDVTPVASTGPQQPFHFDCSVQERAGRERIVDRYVIFDPDEKVLLGIYATLETTVSLALLASTIHDEGANVIARRVGGAAVGVDALALLGMLLFAKQQQREDTYEQLGRWYPLAASCPIDLEVQTSTVRTTIGPGGDLDPSAEEQLVRDLVLQPDALELHLSGITKLVPVDDGARCRMAQQRGYAVGQRCLSLLVQPLAPVTFRLQKKPLPAP